ncbi:hypothetical protein CHLNCDRAFT_143025 [Chlorella variabilis]|uniref:Uncharacterized protein n=1 Tax=Chlorella variabilis TaxID=554065 RepID=E1Z9B7_CHLVA|nr:hypothetical protein CHLNCDRAFT_143025 [Chlorella variabilis]EFN57750.1 hypothetical protein CHLNCDRAFT_143025 [Chlorella variabilis]|eukprot:XP_005849852.1 hypothetical protein CHLNCDRAFT_143025 [Chlorella variabilis]
MAAAAEPAAASDTQFLHEHDQQRIRQQQLEALLAATSFPVARLRQMLQHLVEELRIPATLAFLVDPILLISSIGTFGEPPSSFSRSDTAGDTSGSSSSSSSSSSTWVLQAQQYEIYKFDVSRQVVSNSTVLYADSLAEFEAQARLLFRPGQLSSLYKQLVTETEAQTDGVLGLLRSSFADLAVVSDLPELELIQDDLMRPCRGAMSQDAADDDAKVVQLKLQLCHELRLMINCLSRRQLLTREALYCMVVDVSRHVGGEEAEQALFMLRSGEKGVPGAAGVLGSMGCMPLPSLERLHCFVCWLLGIGIGGVEELGPQYEGELLSWGAMVVRKEEDEAAPVIRVLAGLVQRQDLVSTT